MMIEPLKCVQKTRPLPDLTTPRLSASTVTLPRLRAPSASLEPTPPAFWAVLAGQMLAGQRDETLVSIHIAVYSPASALSAEAVTLAVPTSLNIRPIACVHGTLWVEGT